MAHVLSETCRATDHLFRWGGEEFLLILPMTDAVGAAAVGEKIRANVERETLRGAIPVTVSVGASVSQSGQSIDALLEDADGALYRSKHTGRNRVTCV